MRTLLLMLCNVCVSFLAYAQEWRSSELGWQADQDISSHLADLVKNKMKSGDTLVLEQQYKIAGSNFSLPPSCTLRGINGGGFDIIDVNTNGNSLFLVTADLTFRDLIITAKSAPSIPYYGTKAQPHEHYAPKKVIRGSGKNLRIEGCTFYGNTEIWLDYSGHGLRILNSEFAYGKYQMRLHGDVRDAVISRTVYRNALADGVKTERKDGYGPQNITFTNCEFVDCNRDGIDSAGGLMNGLIIDSIFLECGLDFKQLIEKSQDLSINYRNAYIDIVRCEFIDVTNAIVTTMLNRANLLTKDNADDLMPHHILVRDSVFRQTSKLDHMRAFYIKDGHHINWHNLTLTGHNISLLRGPSNAEAPSGWSAHHIGEISNPGSAPIVPPILPIDPEPIPNPESPVQYSLKVSVDGQMIDLGMPNTVQFPNQDLDGDVIVSKDGTQLFMQGNTWKQFPIQCSISPQTRLRVSLNIQDAGEIIGIGFYEESSSPLNKEKFLQFSGSQSWGNEISEDAIVANVEGVKTYVINLADYFEGSISQLIFCCDHDVDNPTAQVVFSHIEIFEEIVEYSPIITVEEVTLKGSVESSGLLESVKVDGKDAVIDGKKWQITIPVSTGTQYFNIEAVDENKQSSIQTIIVSDEMVNGS